MSIKPTSNKPTPKRQSRKRKTVPEDQQQLQSANGKRRRCDVMSSPFTTSSNQHQAARPNQSYDANVSAFDVTLSSLATSYPVITSTPKRATSRQEKLWRPWLPTEYDVIRYKQKQIQRHMLERQHRRNAQKYLQPVHQQQMSFPGLQRHPNAPQQVPEGFQGVPNSPQHRNPAFRQGSPMPGYHRNFPANQNQEGRRPWSPAVQVSTGFEFFKQPIKLMWPKSKAHDYMFRDGQHLLKQLPFQAAIGLYDDTDSDASEGNHEAWNAQQRPLVHQHQSLAAHKNFVTNLTAVRN